MRTLEPYFVRAVALAELFGLRSERGLAMTYNIVIQQGGGRVRQQWPAEKLSSPPSRRWHRTRPVLSVTGVPAMSRLSRP